MDLYSLLGEQFFIPVQTIFFKSIHQLVETLETGFGKKHLCEYYVPKETLS